MHALRLQVRSDCLLAMSAAACTTYDDIASVGLADLAL